MENNKGPILEAMDAYTELFIENQNLKTKVNELQNEYSDREKKLKDHFKLLRSGISQFSDSINGKVIFNLKLENLSRKDIEIIFGANWDQVISDIYKIDTQMARRFFEDE